MNTTNCPHNAPNCPGPDGYDVNDFSSEICSDCEIEAMCAERPAPLRVNEHGLVMCDHAGCTWPAVRSGRCDRHQDLAEG